MHWHVNTHAHTYVKVWRDIFDDDDDDDLCTHKNAFFVVKVFAKYDYVCMCTHQKN